MTPGRFLRKLPLILAALAGTTTALSGCLVVPRATVEALHAFDLSTVEAEELRFALRLPADVAAGGATLVTTLAVGGQAPDERRYALVEVESAAERAAVAGFGEAGSVVRVFALAPASARSLDAYLAALRAAALAGARQLSVSLALEDCSATAGAEVRLMTLVRLGDGEPYLVLTRERDLGRLVARAGYEAGGVCGLT